MLLRLRKLLSKRQSIIFSSFYFFYLFVIIILVESYSKWSFLLLYVSRNEVLNYLLKKIYRLKYNIYQIFLIVINNTFDDEWFKRLTIDV